MAPGGTDEIKRVAIRRVDAVEGNHVGNIARMIRDQRQEQQSAEAEQAQADGFIDGMRMDFASTRHVATESSGKLWL
jgi:hypothetical protein